MDEIIIKNLEVFCNHGVYPEENKLGQKFIISAALYTDTREAGLTDDLEASIHYGEVCHEITSFLKRNTFKLIERAAEELASHLLRSVKRLKKITIEVKKPWAPIGLSIEYASVKITRQWHNTYIALGSNMGDKESYLTNAIERLRENKDCRVGCVSNFIITPPYGVTDQEEFLNGCLELNTLLSPLELLDCLQEIEILAGRKQIKRWGPRTLDLDILFYDDEIIGNERINVPHMEIPLRDFVLKPLEEIAPNKYHPILKKTVSQLRRELNG